MEESKNNIESREWEKVITSMVRFNENKKIMFPGHCAVCDKDVRFLLDDLYSGEILNFRERLVCPVCHLNNRQRALVSLVKSTFMNNSAIYMYEQITSSYKILGKYYCNLVGSEYFGEEYSPGTIMQNGIRHENAQQLSFKDNSFDCIVSQDVFEHVSDIEASLAEAYRIMRSDGTMLISIPFHLCKEKQ